MTSGPCYRTSVSGSVHEASWFITDGIIRCVTVRPKGMVRHIYTVCINIELGSGCGILHVVLAVVLGEPGSFHVTAQNGICMVFAKAFPAVLLHIKIEEGHGFAVYQKATVLVQLLTPDRIYVGRSPKHIGLIVVVDKQCRILQVVQNGGHSFPVALWDCLYIGYSWLRRGCR